jgi:hypothetical protein
MQRNAFPSSILIVSWWCLAVASASTTDDFLSPPLNKNRLYLLLLTHLLLFWSLRLLASDSAYLPNSRQMVWPRSDPWRMCSCLRDAGVFATDILSGSAPRQATKLINAAGSPPQLVTTFRTVCLLPAPQHQQCPELRNHIPDSSTGVFLIDVTSFDSSTQRSYVTQ